MNYDARFMNKFKNGRRIKKYLIYWTYNSKLVVCEGIFTFAHKKITFKHNLIVYQCIKKLAIRKASNTLIRQRHIAIALLYADIEAMWLLIADINTSSGTHSL